jgi:NAD(P)-dependent dehydrogenase (short-subunit alcohol dehydrogenase family)
MSLAGKVAIVSGAAQGLGRAFAERLVQEGCKVLAFDIQDEVREIEGATTVVADVSRREDVERIVAEAAGMGEIGLLVNNAGKWKVTPVDSSWEQALEDWDYIMDTNLKGLMMISRLVIPRMQAAGNGGHIINLSTYYVLPAKSDGTNNPVTDLYNASKWALNGFTDAWAKYLEKDNIKVNGLCMGAVDTPMLRGLFPDNQLPPGFENVMKADDIAQQMMDVIGSGRSGENFGAWVGEPISIGEQPPLHKRITG